MKNKYIIQKLISCLFMSLSLLLACNKPTEEINSNQDECFIGSIQAGTGNKDKASGHPIKKALLTLLLIASRVSASIDIANSSDHALSTGTSVRADSLSQPANSTTPTVAGMLPSNIRASAFLATNTTEDYFDTLVPKTSQNTTWWTAPTSASNLDPSSQKAATIQQDTYNCDRGGHKLRRSIKLMGKEMLKVKALTPLVSQEPTQHEINTPTFLGETLIQEVLKSALSTSNIESDVSASNEENEDKYKSPLENIKMLVAKGADIDQKVIRLSFRALLKKAQQIDPQFYATCMSPWVNITEQVPPSATTRQSLNLENRPFHTHDCEQNKYLSSNSILNWIINVYASKEKNISYPFPDTKEINTPDITGLTPLNFLFSLYPYRNWGNKELLVPILKTLIEHGANPNLEIELPSPREFVKKICKQYPVYAATCGNWLEIDHFFSTIPQKTT